MQVVGLLVGEVRIADHEVVEAGGVVPEVHPVGVALAEERDERLDPVGVRVEVRDVEAVAAERGAGVGDRPQVLEVVAVAGVRDHDPRRVDARLGQRLQREQTGLRGAFVCTITGAPVSRLAARSAARIRGTSPMSPCSSTQHFRKAALTPVSSIPSRISRTKSSAIASTLRYARKFGSSRNA